MMVVNAAGRHRKVVTYGKHTRRHIGEYESQRDESGLQYLDFFEEDEKKLKTGDSSRNNSRIRSGSVGIRSPLQSDTSDGNKEEALVNSPRRSSRHRLSQVKRAPILPISGKRPQKGQGDILDIASSEDEGNLVTRKPPSHPFPKRRKFGNARGEAVEPTKDDEPARKKPMPEIRRKILTRSSTMPILRNRKDKDDVKIPDITAPISISGERRDLSKVEKSIKHLKYNTSKVMTAHRPKTRAFSQKALSPELVSGKQNDKRMLSKTGPSKAQVKAKLSEKTPQEIPSGNFIEVEKGPDLLTEEPKLNPSPHARHALRQPRKFGVHTHLEQESAFSPQLPSVSSSFHVHDSNPSELKLCSVNLPTRIPSPDILPLGPTPTVSNHSAAFSPKPRQRKRLIDALNESATASSVGESSEEEEDITDITSPVVKGSTVATNTHDLITNEPPSQSSLSREHSFQSSVGTSALGTKVTYSRQRSYLSECASLDNIQSFELPEISQPRPARNLDAALSTFSHASRYIPELDFGEEVDDGGLKSIYELRRSGRNQRFLTAAETLFEDIEDKNSKALSRRRNALLDLCLKLCESDWRKRFLEQEFELRCFAYLKVTDDSICSCLHGIVLLTLLGTGVSSNSLQELRNSDAIEFLGHLLSSDEDIVLLARNHLNKTSKAFQQSLTELCAKLDGLDFWDGCRPSTHSSQAIALKDLDLMVRQSREAGDASDILKNDLFESLTKLLSEKIKDKFLIETIISILESSSLPSDVEIEETAKNSEAFKLLSDRIPQLISPSSNMPVNVRLLTLRLVLNLTNNNPVQCKKFATSDTLVKIFEVVEALFDKLQLDATEEVVDEVILALGCLMNFAEMCETARCRMTTASKRSPSVLDRALKLFVKSREKTSEANSMEQTLSNVAFGYLSVFLCNMCLDEKICGEVRSKLQDGTIQPLLNAAEEFMVYNKKVEAEICDGMEEDSPNYGFSLRLQETLHKLGRG